MVGGDLQPALGALTGVEPLGQLVGDPLGQLPGVHEHERRAVVPDVVGDAVEHIGELGVAGNRLQLGGGELDGDVEVAAVSAVDDRRHGAPVPRPRQQPGHHLEGPLGGRQPDPLEPAAALGHHLCQPFEGQREVGAALVAGQGVDLVDDDGAHPAQHRP